MFGKFVKSAVHWGHKTADGLQKTHNFLTKALPIARDVVGGLYKTFAPHLYGKHKKILDTANDIVGKTISVADNVNQRLPGIAHDVHVNTDRAGAAVAGL